MKKLLLIQLLCICFTSIYAQSDGTLDPVFGTGGLVTVDNGETDDGSDLVIVPDKGILMGGTSNVGGYDFSFCMFTSDGQLNSSFGSGGKLILDIDNGSYDVCYAVALDNSQRIVAAGYSYINGSEHMTVVRMDGDGNLDPTFGGDGIVLLNPDSSNIAFDVLVQPDNKIVVGGYVWDGSTPIKAMIIRLDEDGNYDGGFGDNGVWQGSPDPLYDMKGYCLDIQTDGKILIGGSHDINGDAQFAVGRILPTGSMDTDFDVDGWAVKNVSAGLDIVHNMAYHPDGKIVLAGEMSGQVVVSRIHKDGTDDLDFADAGTFTDPLLANDDYLYDVILQPDDMIVAVGGGSIDDNVDFLLLRLTTDGVLDPGFDGDGVVYTNFNFSNDFAYSVALQSDLKIVAGGSALNYYWNDFAVARYGEGATGFSNLQGSTTISIYPNPANENCLLEVEPSMDALTYTISDITGRLIASGVIPKDKSPMQLKVGSYTPGLYLVEIRNQANSAVMASEKLMIN